jgi:hypothetical protein
MKYLFFLFSFFIAARHNNLQSISNSEIAESIHKAVEMNDEKSLKIFLKESQKRKYDGANSLYKKNRPLHKVNTIACTKLLLKYGANPEAVNAEEKTALLTQVSNLIVLYDTENKADREILIDTEYRYKAIIKLIAKKCPEPSRPVKTKSLSFWNKMVNHYHRLNRLLVSSTLNPDDYKNMMEKLLGVA